MNNQSSTLLKAGLLVGTLDIFSAFTYYYIRTGNKEVWNVLQYVASGAFGKEASTGGAGTATAGLLFHYLIAFSFTLFFFWLYPRLNLRSRNWLLTGILYGLFVWCVMNLVVVPVSRIGSRPFNVTNAVVNALILIVCIGLPLSFLASRFYGQKKAVAAAT